MNLNINNLPELTGNEKQIKWAEDIRKEYIEDCKKLAAYDDTDWLSTTDLRNNFTYLVGVFTSLSTLNPIMKWRGAIRKVDTREKAIKKIEEQKASALKKAEDLDYSKTRKNEITAFYNKTIENINNLVKDVDDKHELKKMILDAQKVTLLDHIENIMNSVTDASWWIDHRNEQESRSWLAKRDEREALDSESEEVDNKDKEIKENRKYNEVKENVEKGSNKIFNDWHKWGLVSEDDFLEAVKWLSEDPMTANPWDSFKDRPTRFLGLDGIHNMENRKLVLTDPEGAKAMGIKYAPDLKSNIIKLTKIQYNNGLVSFTNKEDGTLYEGYIIVDINDLTGPYSAEN